MSEVFPDKFTPVSHTVVGEAAAILSQLLTQPRSIGQIYVGHKEANPQSTFESFAISLTLLYAVGAVDYSDQMVRTS